MSVCMFLKVFGDLCLCYSVVSALPLLFAHEMSFLGVALICGLGAGVSGLLLEQGKGQYRFWGLLFPGAALLLAGSVLEVLTLVPAIVYTAALVIRGNMVLEYYQFRSFYLKSMALWAAFLAVVGLLFGFEQESNQATMTLDLLGALGYGLLYAFSGILLLRRLRLGVDSQNRAQAVNGLQLVLMLAGTVVLVVTVILTEQVFHEDLLALMAEAIPILIATPFVLLGAVASAFMRLIAMLPNFRQLEDLAEEGKDSWADAVTLPTEMQEEVIQTTQESEFPWWLAVLIVVLLTVLLICMLQVLRRHGGGQGSREITGFVTPVRREKPRTGRSNRSKVRKLYRTYLKAEQKSGVKLKTNQTSADILSMASPETDRTAASALRQVYLSARYDESREISPEQVKKAKEALRASRK